MVADEFVVSIILAIIQGITEWLPVSSSGHLVILGEILGFKQKGLFFDVALHFGTLMAVFVYYGEDIVDIIRDLLMGKWRSEKGRLGIFLIIATIPAALAGYFLKNIFELAFSSLEVVALGFGVTGLVLIIGSLDLKANSKLNYKSSFLIGMSQAFALFPGVSRSGTTISSGLLLGLDEKQAVKFSFLMSIPVVFGANILVIGNERLPPDLIWATLVSFIVGLATIHFLSKYVLTKKKNLRWFGAYALLLALILGVWLIFRSS